MRRDVVGKQEINGIIGAEDMFGKTHVEKNYDAELNDRSMDSESMKMYRSVQFERFIG